MAGIVVDECVVMEAVRHKKPDGRPALAEAEFMCRLLRSHHKVFVNDAIVDKFNGIERKINAARRPWDHNNMICKGFLATLADAKRTSYVDGIKVDWKGLKKCDKAFVGVALQSRSILVTSDGPLRGIVDEMRSRGVTLECLGADQAIYRFDQLGRSADGAGTG